MNDKNKRPFFLAKGTAPYRIFWLSLAFALLGTAIFVPLGLQGEINYTLLYVFLGLYLGLYVLTVLINEWVIYRKKHLR